MLRFIGWYGSRYYVWLPPPPPKNYGYGRLYTLLKSDVTRRDHVSVVMDAGSRIVNFIVNFIRDGTVFA